MHLIKPELSNEINAAALFLCKGIDVPDINH